MSMMARPPVEPAPDRAQGRHFEGDLRRVLLEAAATAVGELGVAGVSLRDVARRAEVSHAAPAHHFGDKKGLFTALATEGFVMLADALESADDGRADAIARLTAQGRAYIQFASEHVAHFEVMFRPALVRLDDPEFGAAADRAHGALDRLVAVCRAEGWAADLSQEEASALAWGLAHGLSALRVQGALGRYFPDTSLEGVGVLTEQFVAAFGGQ